MDANNRRKIWQIATWLRDHLDEPHGTPGLASRATMSERHFHRLFVRTLGETPMAHVQRLRLERAASWLVYTDFPVIDAALGGGYESREGFTRIFHAHFGCTPGEFREHARGQARQAPSLCPHELGRPYETTLPPMRLAAWPHVGSALGTATTWLKLGAWGRTSGLLTPHTLAVSVLFDDEGVTPSPFSRTDAALVMDPGASLPADTPMPFVYDLPSGRHLVVPYAGTFDHLVKAWDFLAFRWFPRSGLALRNARMLMLHDPHDVPTHPKDLCRILRARILRCRLCIPVDSVPGRGLPPIHGMGASREKDGRLAESVTWTGQA